MQMWMFLLWFPHSMFRRVAGHTPQTALQHCPDLSGKRRRRSSITAGVPVLSPKTSCSSVREETTAVSQPLGPLLVPATFAPPQNELAALFCSNETRQV